jgi:hypothetical protein
MINNYCYNIYFYKYVIYIITIKEINTVINGTLL